MDDIVLKNTGTISKRRNSDPRRKRYDTFNEVPKSVADNILQYESTSQTSEDELRKNTNDPYRHLPHSPNSLFESRSKEDRERPEREVKELKEIEANKTKDNQPFTIPRKFSSNFQRLIREKSKKAITIKNRYNALTDESEADIDDDDNEIGK